MKGHMSLKGWFLKLKTVPEHYVPKVKSEFSLEEKAEVLKEAKVKNILHNSLDAVMSNRVIACKTAKEIWDTLGNPMSRH